jgi:hypothetical protein
MINTCPMPFGIVSVARNTPFITSVVHCLVDNKEHKSIEFYATSFTFCCSHVKPNRKHEFLHFSLYAQPTTVTCQDAR